MATSVPSLISKTEVLFLEVAPLVARVAVAVVSAEEEGNSSVEKSSEKGVCSKIYEQ